MQGGKLRHRVAIQAATPSKATNGEETLAWSTEATVWASVSPMSGGERFEAQQVKPEVSHRIVMRYRSGVTSKKRILFGSRVFEIDAVMNRDERNEMLTLLCIESV